jgi:hypothetical protein
MTRFHADQNAMSSSLVHLPCAQDFAMGLDSTVYRSSIDRISARLDLILGITRIPNLIDKNTFA